MPDGVTRWLLIVSFDRDADNGAERNWATGAKGFLDRHPGVVEGQTGVHLSGSYGTGDATGDLIMTDAVNPTSLVSELCADDTVVSWELIGLQPLRCRTRQLRGPRIKRNLLLRVDPDASTQQIENFETSLAAMPSYIAGIHSWSLSRARPVLDGEGSWTHVWEQEFPDVATFERDYMQHPYHWTGVDRWFDAEIPDSIVERRFSNFLYEIPRPALYDDDRQW